MSNDFRVSAVTQRIVKRSRDSRSGRLDLMGSEGEKGVGRSNMMSGVLAHDFAVSGKDNHVTHLCAREGWLDVHVDLVGCKAVVAEAFCEGSRREVFAMMRAGTDSAACSASAMLAAGGL